MTASPPRRRRFLGMPFDPVPADAVVAAIAARGPENPFAYVVTPNVDHVLTASRRPDLLPCYHRAWLCVCDSRPLRRLARLFGLTLTLVTGSDLTRRLFAEVLRPGDRIAVIGATPAVADGVRRRFPWLTVCDHCPPLGFIDDPAEVDRCLAFLEREASRARVIFLAVGAPRSEQLAAVLAARGRVRGTALCIGASLEFLTGARQRAPHWMQTLGLEWLFRLFSEPRRLWRRYLLGSVALARLMLRYWRGPAD